MRLLAALAIAAAPCGASAQAALTDHFGLEITPSVRAGPRLIRDMDLAAARSAAVPLSLGAPPSLRSAEFDGQAYAAMPPPAWPGRVRFDVGKYDLRLSPSPGGEAEAVAVLRLGKRLDQDLVRKPDGLGLAHGDSFGDRGRWYLFAAASGRAVGLNMLLGSTGWDPAGWSSDPSSVMIGDAHVGAGWRKGGMQTSLGLIRREVRGRHMVDGQKVRNDSLVAFSFSIRPGD